jgi:acyl-CoA thioester hydrolase
MGEPRIEPLRVRYAECDPQGVVFNANYLAYFDVSITELWRAAFGSYGAMMEKGLDVVVAEAQVRFQSPARFDDALDLEIAIAGLGNTAIHTRHRVFRDGELLVEGSMRHVVVDLKTLTKTPMPDWLRTGLDPWVVSAPRT